MTTRRVNGFQAPLNKYQIYAWALFPIVIVHYFGLLFPLLGTMAAQVVVTLIFLLSSMSALTTGYLACNIDPADDALLCDTPLQEGEPETPAMVYCYLCESNVDLTSKHCRFCDKCIVGFDHHCAWLNTCIGKKNYKYFLATVSAIAIKTTLSLLLSLSFFIETFTNTTRILNANSTILPLVGLQVLLFLSFVFLLSFVSMVLQLGGFHALLVYRGITTYDFIVEQQQKKAERLKRKNDAGGGGGGVDVGDGVRGGETEKDIDLKAAAMGSNGMTPHPHYHGNHPHHHHPYGGGYAQPNDEKKDKDGNQQRDPSSSQQEQQHQSSLPLSYGNDPDRVIVTTITSARNRPLNAQTPSHSSAAASSTTASGGGGGGGGDIGGVGSASDVSGGAGSVSDVSGGVGSASTSQRVADGEGSTASVNGVVAVNVRNAKDKVKEKIAAVRRKKLRRQELEGVESGVVGDAGRVVEEGQRRIDQQMAGQMTEAETDEEGDEDAYEEDGLYPPPPPHAQSSSVFYSVSLPVSIPAPFPPPAIMSPNLSLQYGSVSSDESLYGINPQYQAQLQQQQQGRYAVPASGEAGQGAVRVQMVDKALAKQRLAEALSVRSRAKGLCSVTEASSAAGTAGATGVTTADAESSVEATQNVNEPI